MKAYILCTALVLAGCAQTTGPSAGAAPNGATQAFFPEYPSNLYAAAAIACDGPGQSPVRPNRNELRCESLPDPQTAAGIILEFDGTVEALPTFVISFTGRDVTDGYLVTADNYIRVPLRAGGTQQIRFPDPTIQREMALILEAAGGRALN